MVAIAGLADQDGDAALQGFEPYWRKSHRARSRLSQWIYLLAVPNRSYKVVTERAEACGNHVYGHRRIHGTDTEQRVCCNGTLGERKATPSTHLCKPRG